MEKPSLTKGSVWKGLLAFVLPILAGSLIQQLYVTVDAIIVGQFTGQLGLAAIDSVHTLFKFPLNFMNGLATGATIMISGYYGSGDLEETHCSIRTACTVAVLLGVLCSLGGVLLTPWMLRIMSVPQEVYSRAAAYTRIYFGGTWADTKARLPPKIGLPERVPFRPLPGRAVKSLRSLGSSFRA